MDDWAPQFKSLLSSPLGAELLSQLNIRKQQLQDEAAKAQTSENAFALLKEAGGVIKAIEHLQFRAVAPTDEGGKVK
jgi:hypothetical protein